ncbi:hypothetical protein AUR64_12110 [Haloprofundus marisrubri]|uniref:Uncharacterized protein n=1 Tax=Haloprofundus marisrubri TaxID=1514971 RepID=A0A0W1R9W1_9EURY|nr:DUF5803 family protein [Haloprofundus marisrubri]KTG10313.1 hypothetical protein AUR64_12110 [Haloprofundus marisrubri]
MNRRLLLASAAVVVLLFTSGCLGFFGDNQIPEGRLDGNVSGEYNWDADADVYINISEQATYQAVYRFEGEELRLYRTGFGTEDPLYVEAVRYRYPNGSVINGTTLIARGGSIEEQRDGVVVQPPADAPSNEAGQLAFTGQSTPKQFTMRTFVKGSYEIVLPEDRRVDVPLLSSTRPNPDRQATEDGRVHLYWNDVQRDGISVRFYLQRDLYIFGAILGVSAVVALVGGLYYRRRITELRKQREELGLDVDTSDDGGRRRPPGM